MKLCQFHTRFTLLLCTMLGLCAVASPLRAEDWTRFRGANGAGISTDAKIPTEWGDKKNLQWSVDMPGAGFSSPIAVGDHVFVTCYTGGGRDASNLKRYLVCVDRKKGTKLWTQTVPAVTPEFTERGSFGHHGWASSTPVSDGEHVYVLFGTTGLLAYDLKGKMVWQQSVGKETRNAQFGSASSPILYKDTVIVAACNESATIYAFNKKTGKEAWKAAAGSLSSCYGTPVIAKNKDGEDELINFVAGEVWGMNPDNGKLRWYAPNSSGSNVCTSPLVDGEVVYAIGGGPRSRAMAAIKIGGKDDAKNNVVWSSRTGGPYVPSPILYKGNLYWVDDRGTAMCVNAKTGKEVGQKRLGGQFYASVVLINEKIYAVSRFTGTYVLEASPKMTQIALNKLSDSSDFSGSPAVSNGQLFIRSDKKLHCIAAN